MKISILNISEADALPGPLNFVVCRIRALRVIVGREAKINEHVITA
ncbi:MAG: hypothetical protein VX588_01170 [Verrucomicrobiota bacterium]|nr:hypothetical protein [Verrucomicrobiota bacterium]